MFGYADMYGSLFPPLIKFFLKLKVISIFYHTILTFFLRIALYKLAILSSQNSVI